MGERQRDVVTVADLCRRLKRALESATGRDWVEGELGAVRQVRSGHCYFALKDEREEAVVDCVAYRFHAQKVRRHLVEGARVQVFARATFWAPRGRSQLVVEDLRPAGKGALLEELQRTKERLSAEGLFDSQRKRPLPKDPRCVGVVTSVDGAAWHDIRTVALRRGSPKLVLCSAQVQGEGAVESLLSAIDKLERYPGLEVMIVGRGGGSFEDLLAFSDERVVRRIACCRVPVVSAVGHEIDVSLTDFAADARAATPSEAAELVVADVRSRRAEMEGLVQSLLRAQRARLEDDRAALARQTARLVDPRFLIADKQQWLDDLVARAERCTARSLRECRAVSRRLEQRLVHQHPRVALSRQRAAVSECQRRLEREMWRRLSSVRQRTLAAHSRLEALSPLQVLARGYSITLDAEGRAVRDSQAVRAGQELEVRLHRGRLGVSVLRAAQADETDDMGTGAAAQMLNKERG